MHAFDELDRILCGIDDECADTKAAGDFCIELQARGVAPVAGNNLVLEARDAVQGSDFDRGAVANGADISLQVPEGLIVSGERAIIAILERRGPNPLRIQLQYNLATRELCLEFFNAGLEPRLKLDADLTHVGRRSPRLDRGKFLVGGGEGAQLGEHVLVDVPLAHAALPLRTDSGPARFEGH